MSSLIDNPLVKLVIVFVIVFFVSTLTFVAGISGALTAAVISGIGLLGLAIFIYIVGVIGKM